MTLYENDDQDQFSPPPTFRDVPTPLRRHSPLFDTALNSAVHCCITIVKNITLNMEINGNDGK